MNNFIEKDIAKIIINEEITQETSDNFVSLMTYLEDMEEIKEVHVSLNSPGGSVLAGFAIYSSLIKSSKKIVTINEGVCASIASVIFLAGSERKCFDYALYMVHNASGGNEQALKAINESIQLIYKPYFENSIELMDEETWFNADEMIKLNITTEKVITKDMNKIVKQIFELTNSLVNSKLEEGDSKLDSKLEDRIENEVEDVQNEAEAEEEVIEEVLETEEEVIENDLEAETEEVIEAEVEAEVEVEEEVIVNEISLEETLNEKIALLEKTNEALLAELNNKKEEEIKSEKLAILNKAGIEDVDNWLELDKDKIESLTKTVNRTSVKIENKSSDKLDFKNMSEEAKLILAKDDIKLYRELIKKNK